MTITGIRKGWDRVKNLLDGRPGPDFRPLDVLAAVLNEIEGRVVPAGGGRRVFPHNRIGVKVLLPRGAERSRFEVALDELETKIRKRFHEIDCEAAYPLDVRIQFLKKAPAAWSAEQIVALELQKGSPDHPAAATASAAVRQCSLQERSERTHSRNNSSCWVAPPRSAISVAGGGGITSRSMSRMRASAARTPAWSTTPLAAATVCWTKAARAGPR